MQELYYFAENGGLDDLGLVPEVHFDPWLQARGPNLLSMIDEVFRRLEGMRPALSRRPRADALARRRLIVGTLITNLAAAEWSKPGTRVSLSTANSALTRYDRRGFPKALVVELVADLEMAGLIFFTRGIHRVMTSVIEATSTFRALMSSLGPIDPSELLVTPGRETIVLRAPAVRHGRHTHRGQLIDYRDTLETVELRAQMHAINQFLATADITLDGRQGAPPQLTRYFQSEATDRKPKCNLHGRLYGGFWINMHRDERHRIRINGEEPIDLDFISMFTSISYVMAGHEPPSGDPYDGIAGLDLARMSDPSHRAVMRGAIKQALNAMFFCRGPMMRLPRDVKTVLGGTWTAARLTSALRHRHAPIAHLFETGVGFELMYIESQIMVRFLLDLIPLGIVALPIHDGALVAASDERVALATMRSASSSVLGVPLAVKAKRLPERITKHP